jgi:hypothetical protein
VAIGQIAVMLMPESAPIKLARAPALVVGVARP